jgi:dienelactone hydrolase
MSSQTVAPYGEWVSPITASMLTSAVRPLNFPTFVGDEIWWVEGRPQEAGRSTVMARRADSSVVELLPAPWNVRSRVHEYGGRAFLGVPTPNGPTLVFAHFDDQRLYRLDPGATEPVPLTPVPTIPSGLRYADLVLAPDGATIVCVRERHTDSDLDRHLVAVPLDGSAADDPSAVREIVGGSRFLAYPRISPDGRRVAWLAWDHPRMPWDGTELRVGTLADGRVSSWTTVLGGPAESVFQPEWADAETLYAVSDATGWWNPYRVPASGGQPELLYQAEEEFAFPLWMLGLTSYGLLPDGALLCVHGTGTQRLGRLDPRTGELADLDLPYDVFGYTVEASGHRAVAVVGGPTVPNQVVVVDTRTGRTDVIRTSIDPSLLPDEAYLPRPESTALRGPDGREIHVHIYPPTNPDYVAPADERPPYVVHVHGGPTANSPAALDLSKAYLTSRGIGVLDVNYGGSTGYGRAYRERLRGQWGIVDVEDAAAAAQALVARGDADPARLAIEGGSAGGWTTLCAVTRTDVFAAGVSFFGVSDLRLLAATTHDFESRYLDGLVGGDVTTPEYAAIADERSPLTHADKTRCPVLLLQGGKDPVVPLEQAEKFRDALARAGVPHALVVFENEMHGFRSAEAIIAATEAELAFYGQVMGFRPPGVEPIELTS